MKAHTSQFKNAIKEFGRELDSKITYELDGETIELGSEELNSITPHYEGAILKSVMKQLDIDSNVEIPLGTILTYEFGLKVGNGYEYINYGNYVVKTVEKQEDTRSWLITCYDKMLYTMKDYENSDIVYPITVRDYIGEICEKVGLTFASINDKFVNYDKEISSELYLDNEGRSLGYTFRTVLDELAQVTASTICINEDDELEIRYIKDVGELVTATGSSLELNTDDDTELIDFALEGKTTQETTTGKNKANTSSLTQYVHNGITFTPIYENGLLQYIQANGTATAVAYIDIAHKIYDAGSYILTGSPANGSTNSYRQLMVTSSFNAIGSDDGNGATVTLDGTTQYFIRLRIASGYTANNIKFYPMLRLASVSDATYEPYTGGIPAPSSDYPSELKSVGYENLFDKNSFTQSTYIYPCKEGDTFTFSFKGYATSDDKRIFLRTYEGAFVSNLDNYNDQVMNRLTSTKADYTMSITSTINGIVYIRTATGHNNYKLNNAQLTKGTQQHSYIPYGKYGVEVVSHGKNLFNINDITHNTLNQNDGITTTTNNSITLSNYIRITPNATYKAKSDADSYIYRAFFYDKDKKYLGTKTYRDTLTYNANYIRLQMNNNFANANFQLEQNTSFTPYEPYQESTTLFTLNEPLREWDRLYYENGKVYVERNSAEITVTNVSTVTINNMKSNGEFMSSVGGTLSGNTIAFGETVDEATIQYELATPTIEDLGYIDMPATYSGKTYIDTIDELEPNITLSYVSNYDIIDEKYLKDINVNFGEKFGPVNTLILSRGGDGDKIALSKPTDLADEDKIAIQITDNQIMNDNNRADFMEGILNKLYGLEYYINDFSSTGITYYDLCDRYRVKVGNNTYKCIMFNDEVDITQGLQELIYTNMQEENEQEYKYIGSTDRGITQANIIANKADATISSFTQQLDATNNRLNSVEVKQTATDETINIISTNIDANGNITEVTTTTGFTFNADGMTIADSSTNFSALHRNTGTYYYDGDTITGQYTKDGSKQKDLELFGVYSYGKEEIEDTPMFVAQLYTDENGEIAFGHFYNGV